MAAHSAAACRHCSAAASDRLADVVSALWAVGQQGGHPNNVYEGRSGAAFCATGSPVMTQVTRPGPPFKTRQPSGLDWPRPATALFSTTNRLALESATCLEIWLDFSDLQPHPFTMGLSDGDTVMAATADAGRPPADAPT